MVVQEKEKGWPVFQDKSKYSLFLKYFFVNFVDLNASSKI